MSESQKPERFIKKSAAQLESERKLENIKKFGNRKGNLNDSTRVLEQVLTNNKSPLTDQFMRWKLWRKWPEVVGPTISAQSMPVGFVKGILYVWVKNAVWMQEMLFLAGPVKEKVNDFVGKKWVKQVRFTLNQHEVPQVSEESEVKDNLTDIEA